MRPPWRQALHTPVHKETLFLQIRIEQVLTANLPLVLCFKLSQLLAFYGRTVEQMIGSGGKLTHTLAECHHLSTTVFHDQLRARGNRLLHHKAAPPKDLAVPQQVSLLLVLSLLSPALLLPVTGATPASTGVAAAAAIRIWQDCLSV